MTDSGAKTSFFDQFALGREYKRVYNRVAQPSHPLSIQLVAFWREKEKDGGLVAGRDVPSRAISGILRNLIIYEPLAESTDFRIRHAGTAYIAHYGMDVTGMMMSELFDDDDVRSHNFMIAEEVIRTDTVEIFDANLSQFGIARRHYEVVLLPVMAPDRASKWLLCGLFRFD